ncbi:MAG: DUF6219 family protein [Clostridiales bacterium]|nr:DUF6219 family protein [Clostridiales bacterium]
MLKKHRFWAAVMIISAIMCVWTGHQMIHGKSKKPEKD